MSNKRLLLSEKYKAFLKHDAPVEFLEGTTAAGKTTVGLFKFMLKVAESPKKLHIIAAKDTGTAEKNIINKDLGITDDFGILTEYNGNGTKDDKIPHILFHTSGGDKVIYVLGYGDKKKWQKALGGQYGLTGSVAPYTQIANVPGMIETDRPTVSLYLPDGIAAPDVDLQSKAYDCVNRAVSGNGNITVYCYKKKPAVDFQIQVKGA